MKQKQRDDYRCVPNSGLVDEARRGTNVDYKELALAMAERLEGHRYGCVITTHNGG